MKYIKFIPPLIFSFFVYYFGFKFLGYHNPLRLYIIVTLLASLSSLINWFYNEFVFKANLERTATSLAENYYQLKFPPPQKYDYLTTTEKNEIYYGQTYLEEIVSDAEVEDESKFTARFYLSDIYKAEKSDFILERRLMRLTLTAMIKYNEILNKYGAKSK